MNVSVQPAMSKVEHDEALLGELLSGLEEVETEAAPADDEILLTNEEGGAIEASALLAELQPESAAAEETSAETAAKPQVKKSAAKKAEPKAESEARKAPVKRQYFADKIDRLKHRVADDFDSVLKEAGVTEAQLREAGVKVKNRIGFVVEYATGKSDRLNNVVEAALKVLERDGNIVTGEKGNLIQKLVSQGKKITSARAMAGNTVAAMRLLQMIEPAGAQTYVASKSSNILKSVTARLRA